MLVVMCVTIRSILSYLFLGQFNCSYRVLFEKILLLSSEEIGFKKKQIFQNFKIDLKNVTTPSKMCASS